LKPIRTFLALSLLALSSTAAAEVLFSLAKTPFEAITCSMDFIQVIGADGTTLVSVTSRNAAGIDTTTTIIAPSPVPGVVGITDKVAFRIQGGKAGETHIVSVKVRDAITGDQFEGTMTVTIGAN
jgi:hypothetical protein